MSEPTEKECKAMAEDILHRLATKISPDILNFAMEEQVKNGDAVGTVVARFALYGLNHLLDKWEKEGSI